nr:MAG TPA: hypothetical protein [Caudoviricetes sp.]
MNMDIIAKRIVRRYVEEHLDKSGKEEAEAKGGEIIEALLKEYEEA